MEFPSLETWLPISGTSGREASSQKGKLVRWISTSLRWPGTFSRVSARSVEIPGCQVARLRRNLPHRVDHRAVDPLHDGNRALAAFRALRLSSADAFDFSFNFL